MNEAPKILSPKDAQVRLISASEWIASFEPSYPELFNSFRAQGWHPKKYSQQSSGYGGAAERFSHNSKALEMELEFGGMSLLPIVKQQGGREFQFSAGPIFEDLTYSWPDYDEDVHQLLPETPFPVGEGFRRVLFVSETGQAAMISDILNAYLLADDPFILLDYMLFGRDFNPKVRDMVVAQGSRVSGRPKT